MFNYYFWVISNENGPCESGFTQFYFWRSRMQCYEHVHKKTLGTGNIVSTFHRV